MNAKPLLRKIPIAIWVLILVLILVRIFLPVGVKYGINWYLGQKLQNYEGHLDDFGLALYRGAYQFEGLRLWKKGKSAKDPLIEIKHTDLSLAWRALFKGKLLGDLKVDGVLLNLVDSQEKKKQQFGGGEDWKTVVGKLIPIELESFKLTHGEVLFVNKEFKVPVKIVMDEINAEATNIKNTDDRKELLPSTVQASARLQKSAKLHAEAKINLLSRLPAFESKFKLDKLDVTKLNDFFLAYGSFTVHSGKFSLYGEVSTKENMVKGYVKPFFENLDVMSPKEKFESPKRFFNEVAIAWANVFLRNSKDHTVATKIEFEGASKAPNINKWGAFWESLRNGFVEALKKQLDEKITIKDVPKKK
ncbi:DUF748 domain-containing protein [Bdellovibrio sp. HCB-162]|uniref:DUF748 domain-containing protein n=1 Tax=Bdellovibrio sp. HCB-162 TaxID=3394234 RepID=UPI0039BCAAFB